MEKDKLILASASPRRRKILEDAGYVFAVIVRDVEEITPSSGDPFAVACDNSLAKASVVAGDLSNGIVIASDTVVALEGGIIGKPSDEEDAFRILHRLSGTRHSVISGLALVDAATGRSEIASDETFVTMKKMTDSEIAAYVASGEAMGKAGAYAIQETGDRFVEKLEGSFANVVGFPLEVFRVMLDEFTKKDGRKP